MCRCRIGHQRHATWVYSCINSPSRSRRRRYRLGSYQPLMSQERAERIWRWHTSAYRELSAGTGCNQTFATSVGHWWCHARSCRSARNGVADRIEVRHSDVFSNVDDAFDLIIFDPPFRGFAPAICWKLPPPTKITPTCSCVAARSVSEDQPAAYQVNSPPSGQCPLFSMTAQLAA